jgi:hypothetical protein
VTMPVDVRIWFVAAIAAWLWFAAFAVVDLCRKEPGGIFDGPWVIGPFCLVIICGAIDAMISLAVGRMF